MLCKQSCVMDDNKIIKKRGTRCTNDQMAMMINFIDDHKIMVLGKLSPQQISEVESNWKELSQHLNKCKGAQKNVDQWKRTFIEYKSKVRAKARELKIDQQGTGGGTGKTTNLSDTEDKVMGILGWVSCDGDPKLSEPGLPTEHQPINIEPPTDDTNIEEVIDAIVTETGSDLVEDTDNNMKKTNTHIKKPKPAAPSRLPSFKPRRSQRQQLERPLDRIDAASKLYQKNAEILCSSLDSPSNSLNNVVLANKQIAKTLLQLATK